MDRSKLVADCKTLKKLTNYHRRCLVEWGADDVFRSSFTLALLVYDQGLAERSRSNTPGPVARLTVSRSNLD